MHLNGEAKAVEFLTNRFKFVNSQSTLDQVFGSNPDRIQEFHEELKALAPAKKLPHQGAFRFDECTRYRNAMLAILTSH
jgi:hypothetical protein